MPIPITIPRLGWNMDEGTFAGWLKQDGEAIRPGDRIFTLESEKATEEIECLDGGILHIPADAPKMGDKLAVGAVIGFLLQPGEPPGLSRRSGSPEDHRDKPGGSPVPKRSPEDRRDKPGGSPGHFAISPRARRKAHELGIDYKNLQGTGRTGRIRERDVVAAAEQSIGLIGPIGPISPMRRTIAERMLHSARSTAPVTLTTTADATGLVRRREEYRAAGGIVPSYTDLFVKLVSEALREHPALNSRWDGDRIVASSGIHIGIAVDTDAGLVVPVIHDVPQLSIEQIAARSRELIEKARAGKLRAEEMQGGTFTITNLGAYGIDAFTPIINHPECAILGIGRIAPQPVVIDRALAVRDMVTLSLTFDHRIVDGAPAARFLAACGLACTG